MEYRKEFENEINDRAAWRAGLLHRFTDTEGMARSRIACKETEQAGYKGFLCFTTGKGTGYGVLYIKENGAAGKSAALAA